MIVDRSFRLDGGNGKGVLLIHGLTGAPGEMKMLARKLNRAGFAISAPQLAGHGGDQKALLATGWRDWLASVEAEYERFSREVDEVSVAGICVGGMLGLLLARAAPAVRAAVVYSMTYRYDGWNMKGWYSRIVPFARPFASLPLIRTISFAEPPPFGIKDERLRKLATSTQTALIPGALDRFPLGAMHQMHILADHLDRVAPEIRTPALLVHAHEDDMAHPRNSERLKAALGERARLSMVEDSYHMLHLDKQRDAVAALTSDFVNEHAASPAAAMATADA